MEGVGECPCGFTGCLRLDNEALCVQHYPLTHTTSLLRHTGCDLGYSFLFETFCTTGVTSTKLIV